jgi:hypothetical protein
MLQQTQAEGTALTKLGDNMIHCAYASNALTPTAITNRWLRTELHLCNDEM